MVDYRNILRLQSQGHSQREIERELYCSRHTISEVLIRAKSAGIAWPLEDDVTNEDIQAILFPGKYAYASPYTVPDYAYMHRELAKNGVTLTLLWEEYCVKVRGEGGVPYSYTQYCEKYRRWARVTKATMRITHKPGDAMQVDWAGDPLYITDSVTGEQWPAYIFVAVLPCSWYTYAEACGDMKQENWLLCHVHAFDYFGGVPRLLIPDNAKTATITNNRYDICLIKYRARNLLDIDIIVSIFLDVWEQRDFCTNPHLTGSRIAPENFNRLAFYGIILINCADGNHLTCLCRKHTVR